LINRFYISGQKYYATVNYNFYHKPVNPRRTLKSWSSKKI